MSDAKICNRCGKPFAPGGLFRYLESGTMVVDNSTTLRYYDDWGNKGDYKDSIDGHFCHGCTKDFRKFLNGDKVKSLHKKSKKKSSKSHN